MGFHFENIRLQREIENERIHIEHLRSSQILGDDEEISKNINRIVGRFYPGFYNEKTQQKIGEEDNEDRKDVAMDDGIPMIYYLVEKGGKKLKRKTVKRKSVKRKPVKRKSYKRKH